MFSTVLEGVKVLPDQGYFRMDRIQAVFLPEPTAKSKTIYPYDPKEGGKLHTVIRKKDGTVVEVATWYASKLKPPYWLLESYELKDTKTTANYKLPGEGEYLLDFYLEGKLFYRFPFKLVAVGSDDPFDPGKVWQLEGAWNDYGYLFYADANPSNALAFKLWLQKKGKPKPGEEMKAKAEIVRMSDGKVLCIGTGNYRPRPNWIRYDFMGNFRHPENDAVYYTKELLGQDGAYEVRISINEEPYGTYPFEIKGGKIQYQGRAVRGETNPLIFVEGGRDAWWLRRKEAPPEDLTYLTESPPKTLAGVGGGVAGGADITKPDDIVDKAAKDLEGAAKEGLKGLKGLGDGLKGLRRK
jgi:hypothetical protein